MKRLIPVLAVLASGCMTAPSPRITIAPPTATGAFADLPTASIEPVPDDWWRLYDDPVLDRLVQASLAANADVRVAYANLDGARAAVRQARAARLPQTTVETGLTVDNSAGQPSASSNVPTTDYDLALTASWDADVFGRLRSAALAARADAAAQEAALDGVRVAVVADTVLAYVELCGATQALAAVAEQVGGQRNAVTVTRDQLNAGDVSPLEVSQAESLLASTTALQAPLEAAQTNARYRLATLAGRPPAEARTNPVTCDALPKLRTTAPIGDGAALLLRRPDIREAERRLAAAAARIGVARADLYPRVNLGGAIGLLTGRLVSTGSPLVSWAFPNQAPARARLAQARASERAALAGWDVAVLRALREVETALAVYDAEQRRNQALLEADKEARLTARRAAARVRLGDAAPLLRLDADRTVAQASLAVAQSDLAIAQAQVALFRALGGGWRMAAPPLE